MRAKRSKQYRKLMQQYGLSFGFREPYQVVVDAQILLDAAQFKMDFIGLLRGTLHGQVKPMITQCSMRHLYAAEPKPDEVIEHAKAFERRRCNHHELESPLSTLECLSSVVDAKESQTNKNRYIIASQDTAVRNHMRTIPGVPIVYLKRSVMIMEPMNHATEQARNSMERSKLREGLKQGIKRKLTASDADPEKEAAEVKGNPDQMRVRKKAKGAKGPNPLSVKKSKKKNAQEALIHLPINAGPGEQVKSNDGMLVTEKRKRRRRHNTHKQETSPQGQPLDES